MIFVRHYATATQRRNAHAKILLEQEQAIKDQAESYVVAVEKYIRDRRFWEIETVAMLFDEHRHRVLFPAPYFKVLELLLEWAPTEDPVLGYGIHKPIPEYDLAEFGVFDDAETEERHRP